MSTGPDNYIFIGTDTLLSNNYLSLRDGLKSEVLLISRTVR
jgi:hypothetical protein